MGRRQEMFCDKMKFVKLQKMVLHKLKKEDIIDIDRNV